ncbi:glycosyltransferase family 2 protein [Nakamurella leprariae]|uniref:Glycosyltransferase family 2 protein n=1 Tax=Nakamurella leprariae TaxID=2803911 RepID=A0A939BYK9_9ACTN|nr:glycosyltransferase family 2 protein [Nakamurella leprariae]MBM9466736.1 glycosyltransferase family 2 protein [Nakamurella leprariae]
MKSVVTAPGPTPVSVVSVDVERPAVDLSRTTGYDTALVVFRQSGIPREAREFDLRRPADVLRDDVAAAAGEIRRPVGDVRVADGALPSISVVVPTMVSRVVDLQLLLDGFRAVDYPDVEFILVDNRSHRPADDPLDELVARFAQVRVARALRPGISAARNAGVAAARGEIVAFTDDDVRVDPNWLRALGSRFAVEPELDAVTGMILPAELETPAQIWFERYYGGFSGERTFEPVSLHASPSRWKALSGARVSVRGADGRSQREFSVYGVGAYGAGANMAFRRSTLRRIGGFDVSLGTGTAARGGEDLAALIAVLFNGGSIGFEPASVVHHRHRREVPELLHQLHGNGLGFTAMLTSLIRHDGRHLLALAAALPNAAHRFTAQSLARVRGGAEPEVTASTATSEPEVDHGYPRQLLASELRGMPSGPLAYLRSRRANRRWDRGHLNTLPTGRTTAPSAAASDVTGRPVAWRRTA